MDKLNNYRRANSFKVVIRKVERPFSGDIEDYLNWMCQTFGFFEPIDKDKTAASIFKELVKATEKGEALTSTALAERVDMSRGAVINHLNNLIRSGLVQKYGRYYEARSRSIFRTVKEIEEDILRVFREMERTARDLDQELGILNTSKSEGTEK